MVRYIATPHILEYEVNLIFKKKGKNMKKSTKIIISAVLVTSIALSSAYFYNEWANDRSDKVIYNGKEMSFNDWRMIKTKNGIVKYYLNNGKLEFERTYKDDKKISEVYYDENGKVSSKETYKDDNITFQVVYNENGKVFSESTYKDEKIISEVYYDRNGKVSSKETYKDGKKISEVNYDENGNKI